jgi:PIN like domain
MSVPPPASSWAAPPEFYIDESMAGRSVRRFIAGLGYRVHTPTEVFGRQRLDDGISDEEWLAVAGRQGWAVFGRDHHVLSRELELQAYLKAKVHMFLLPGTATRDQILELVSANLAEICARASARQPGVYWLRRNGLEDYPYRLRHRRRRGGNDKSGD